MNMRYLLDERRSRRGYSIKLHAEKDGQRVTIGTGVESIGESAFTNCYDLENVTIPGSVTSIDTAKLLMKCVKLGKKAEDVPALGLHDLVL